MGQDKSDKAARLAQALRDNLKRRKAQTRERTIETPPERDAEPVSPPEAPSRD